MFLNAPLCHYWLPVGFLGQPMVTRGVMHWMVIYSKCYHSSLCLLVMYTPELVMMGGWTPLCKLEQQQPNGLLVMHGLPNQHAASRGQWPSAGPCSATFAAGAATVDNTCALCVCVCHLSCIATDTAMTRAACLSELFLAFTAAGCFAIGCDEGGPSLLDS
jgi:hypothetical protein